MSRVRASRVPLIAAWLVATLYPATAVHARRKAPAQRIRVFMTFAAALTLAAVFLSAAAGVTAPPVTMRAGVYPAAAGAAEAFSALSTDSVDHETPLDSGAASAGHQSSPRSGLAAVASARGSADSGMVTVTFTIRESSSSPSSTPRLMCVYRFYNRQTDTHFYTYSEEERLHVIATWPNIFRFEGPAYNVDLKSDTSTLHRFYNVGTKTHFYTASEEEKATVLRTWATVYRYEGPAYPVSLSSSPGKLTVHRFYNLRSGTHFYTASEQEKTHIIASFPSYRYEGIAFWVGP